MHKTVSLRDEVKQNVIIILQVNLWALITCSYNVELVCTFMHLLLIMPIALLLTFPNILS